MAVIQWTELQAVWHELGRPVGSGKRKAKVRDDEEEKMEIEGDGIYPGER